MFGHVLCGYALSANIRSYSITVRPASFADLFDDWTKPSTDNENSEKGSRYPGLPLVPFFLSFEN